MVRRTAALLVIVLLALAGGAMTAAAAASLADEVAAGRVLSDRLAAGEVACADLTRDDFDHIGEYVMNRMVGSLARHDALNARMTAMMGADAEGRMHVLMGERFAGCPAAGAAPAGAMGPAMMAGAASGPGPWSRMMASGTWAWMGDGRWEGMSRGDWRRLGAQWMGPGMMRSGGGWGAAETALVIGGVLVLAALAGGVLAWNARGGRRPPPAPPRPSGPAPDR